MASNRFAQRISGIDSGAERRMRAALAMNVAQQVLALNEARMRLSGARDLGEACAVVDRMLAERQPQIAALGTEAGHA